MPNLTDQEKLLVSRDPDEAVELVRQLFKEAGEYYQDDYAQITEDMAYVLDHDHYQGERRRSDPLDMRARMADLYNHNRHKAARIGAAEVYPQTHPVDEYGDAEMAEFGRRVMEIEMEAKRFRPEFRTAVSWLVNAGLGVMKLHLVPGYGGFGLEVHPKAADPRRSFLAPGFLDPHDPLCPWWMEVVPMRMQALRALGKGKNGWRIPEDLRPDKGAMDTFGRAWGDRSGRVDLTTSFTTEKALAGDVVWTAQLWHKLDGKTKKLEPRRVLLPPSERYMLCLECGQPDEAQGRGEMLPEMGMPCPDCGAMTERVDELEEVPEVLAYPNGRLIIAPINQPWLAPFVDGPWPERDLGDGRKRTMRSFPVAYFRNPLECRKLKGMSDTQLHNDEQMMIDAVFTMAFWQMVTNQSFLMTLKGGLHDVDGNPWTPTGNPRQMLIVAENQMVAAATHYLQGSGVSPGFPPMLQAVKANFEGTKGTFAPSRSAEEMKNVPVGTIEAYERSGEVPVDDQVDSIYEELGPYLGTWLDLWCITTTEAKAIRYFGEDGKAKFKMLQGADLPQVDMVVSAKPTLDARNIRHVDSLIKVLALAEPQREFVAEELNLPKSKLARMRELEAEAKAAAGGQPPGTPARGAPATVPAALMQRMAGQGGMPGPNGGMS